MAISKRLKIAMVATPWLTVPPKGYGGIELIISHLTEELIKRGHHVTLYSVRGSRTKARLKYYFNHEQYNVIHRPDANVMNVALAHSSWAYQDIAKNDFDIVHDHTWKEGLISGMWLPLPILHTLHGPMDDFNQDFYSTVLRRKNLNFVTISKFQRRGLPELNYVANIPNAIDVDSFRYGEGGGYFVFLGRINEDKGVHIACKAAKKLNLSLRIAGPPIDPDYFAKHVKPYLSSKIRYIGEVSDAQKKKLLQGAKGFLFPIQWHEPFGLVMIEAMAAGTPVVTFDMGSAREIVTRQTGFVVKNYPDFLDAISKIDKIDRVKCREYVMKNFSISAMTDKYENAYQNIIARYAKSR